MPVSILFNEPCYLTRNIIIDASYNLLSTEYMIFILKDNDLHQSSHFVSVWFGDKKYSRYIYTKTLH